VPAAVSAAAMRCSDMAAARMRHSTACRSALTVGVHITASFIVAAEKIQIRRRSLVVTTIIAVPSVTAIHITPHASRQDRHQDNPEPKLDLIRQTVRFVHTDLPFAEKIKKGSVGSTAGRALFAPRLIFSTCGSPSGNNATIDSPNINSIFGLVFMRRESSAEGLSLLWGQHPIAPARF